MKENIQSTWKLGEHVSRELRLDLPVFTTTMHTLASAAYDNTIVLKATALIQLVFYRTMNS